MTLVPDDRRVQRVNRWFDGLPRERIVIGGGDAPAFRALGVVGFHAGLAVGLVAAAARGYPIWIGIGAATVAGLSFFAWALLRRAATGDETIVLFEHVLVAGVAVAGFVWWTGEPILGWLDVLAVALCWFLALGRVGCTVTGCCHGHPSRLGIIYHRCGSTVHRLAGVRLFPVQLVEAIGLALVGGLALLLVPFVAEGRVLVVVMTLYGVLRFGTEALRGDRRPAVLGVPVARTAAACAVVAAAVLDQAQRDGAVDLAPLLAVGALLVGASLVGARWMGHRVRLGADQVEELRAIIDACEPSAQGEVRTHTIEPEVVVGLSWTGDQCHVSLSSGRVTTAALAHLLRSAAGSESSILESASGVVHAVIGPRSQPPGELGEIRTAYFRHAEG